MTTHLGVFGGKAPCTVQPVHLRKTKETDLKTVFTIGVSKMVRCIEADLWMKEFAV